jgi:hypothetical protein
VGVIGGDILLSEGTTVVPAPITTTSSFDIARLDGESSFWEYESFKWCDDISLSRSENEAEEDGALLQEPRVTSLGEPNKDLS